MSGFLGRSRFKQVSFFYSTLLFAMTASILMFRWGIRGDFDLVDLTNDPGLMLAYAIAFALMIALPDRRESHIAQVCLIISYGIVVVFVVAPRDLGGDLSVLLAGALAYRYGLLDSFRILKLSLIMGSLILTRIAAVFYYPEITIDRAINQIVIILAAVPFLYLIFERDFIRVRRDREELATDRERNRSFVEFGRNVSGIVHDFRNDHALFSSYNQLLTAYEGEPLDRKHVDMLSGYVARFGKRIERLLFVTRHRGVREIECFDLGKAVRSALYVFEANLDLRRKIEFSCDCKAGEVTACTNPDELMTILENLFRNSCEAVVKAIDLGFYPDHTTPEVSAVIVTDDAQGVVVAIEDNGPGFPPGTAIDRQEGPTAISHLLDDTGTSIRFGLGLDNVRKSARRIGTRVFFTRKLEGGTRAEVLLPPQLIAAVSVDSPNSPSIY